MKKSDIERLKKIVSLWEALSGEIMQRGITRELLLTEQFSQWAVTTPIYNIFSPAYGMQNRRYYRNTAAGMHGRRNSV